MGQYFTIYNHTKEQFYSPTNGLKAIETATTPYVGSMLLYLFTDIPDEKDPAGMAGSWIGDDVRIQGDYHPDEVDSVTKVPTNIKYDGEEYEVLTSVQGPVNLRKSDFDYGDVIKSHRGVHEDGGNGFFSSGSHGGDTIYYQSGDPEPEDTVVIDLTYIDHIDGENKRFAEFLGEGKTEYECIHDDITAAVEKVINDPEWVNMQDEFTVLRPDALIFDNEDGGSEYVTGPHTMNPPSVDGNVDSSLPDSTETNYIILNKESGEYIVPDNTDHIISTLTNPVTNCMLMYLLFNSKQDGTRFLSLHNPHTPDFKDEISEKMESERERHRNSGRSSTYRKDDDSWDKRRLTKVITASHMITDDFIYAGRWHGDGIEMIELTDEQREEIDQNPKYFNITNRVREAVKLFVSDEWVMENQMKTASVQTVQTNLEGILTELSETAR